MAEKGNRPSAHPSHKLAYLFSASHGHEHPATIQWSLLDASDQVHKYFACCRAWGFYRRLSLVWTLRSNQVSISGPSRSSLACDSFSCGEGRHCPLSLPSGLSEGTVIAPRSTSTSAAHPNPLHPAEADSISQPVMVGHVVLARNQGQSLFSRANKAVWITRDGVSAHQLMFCADSQISHQYLPNMFLGSGGNGKATSRLGWIHALPPKVC